MDIIQKAMRSVRKVNNEDMALYASYGVFVYAIAYILYSKQFATVGLAVGVSMILYAATAGNMMVALLAGAVAGVIAVYYSRVSEGFEDAAEAEEAAEADEAEEEAEEAAPPKKAVAVPKKKKKAVAPPPDHRERAEMFELGKKYEMPKEEEDGEFHLDAGTTFMNAYKSLKPDQIAAMTKDTQELMATQKQLMSTLQTLKPLITDGKEMMDMFQSYFGGGQASLT